MKRLTVFLCSAVVCAGALADSITVKNLRTWPAPDNTRVVFDVSGAVDYQLFSLDNPPRLVVDLSNARLDDTVTQPSDKDGILKGIRSAPRNGSDLRVVFDLAVKAKYKSFSLKPTDGYGDRLVIDLYDAAETTAPRLVKTLPDSSGGPRDIVVAIDAGHGGEDPGARGYSGVYEKDVVLAIAKQLQTLVRREPGMRPVMTRSGDYFISLRKRTLKARQEKADIFVSIHADSFRDRRVSGTSLYVLSKHGATDEAARWLAEKENSSDLIGGVSLDDKDDLLASVLLDLSQTATIEASYAAGEAVLQRLHPLGMLHKTTVQQAGFVVLKSPDIPSLLVETAYLSNPRDERKLRSPRHQRKMAEAILDGIRDYFSKSPPAGTLFAARRHVITPGETLSQLAVHYRVSVARIKAANHLKGDVLNIGQVLRIPPDSEG